MASPEDELPVRESLAPRDLAWLALACLPMLVVLGSMQPWGSEGRWLCISREMLETGDWWRPTINRELWAWKPLLSFWIIAVLGKVFGGVTLFLARLPSVLAAAGAVWLTAWIGARLVSRRAGIFAGVVLATCNTFFLWGRTASNDMLNVPACLAGVAFYLLVANRPKAWHVLAFCALLGLAANAKGTPAIIVPAAVAVADIVRRKRWETLRLWPALIPGLALCAFLYLAGFMVTAQKTGVSDSFSMTFRDNIGRIFAPENQGDNSVASYLYTLPAMFLPWSLWFPGAFAWFWKRPRTDRGPWFILVAFAVIFCLFTASASRRSYYILPIVPWCALLVGVYWDRICAQVEGGEALSRLHRILGAGPVWLILGLLGVAGIGLAGASILRTGLQDLILRYPGAVAASVSLPIVSAVSLFLLRNRPLRARFATLLALGGASLVYAAIATNTYRDARLPQRPFAEAVRAHGVKGEVTYFCADDARLYWFLGSGPISRDVDTLHSLIDGKGEVWVVADSRYLIRLATEPRIRWKEELRYPPELKLYKTPEDVYVLLRCEAKR